MKSKLSFVLTHYGHVLVCALLFALLLARNPFGIRTQIPNFEPYPDSFHYIVPARSMLAGTGPYLSREGRHINPSVPIIYSLTLVPFFAIYNDPRMFYIANVVFSFISLGLFYLILNKLKVRKVIQLFVLFLYVTNYYMYWYPSLAMAETLTMVLFFASLLMLIIRVTPVRAAGAALFAVSLYFTKYANIPLTVSFGLLYAFKLFFPVTQVRAKQKEILFFVLAGLSSFGLLSLWEFYFYGRSLIHVITSLFLEKAAVQSVATDTKSTGTSFFSFGYIPMNLRFYVPMLLGSDTKILWIFKPLLPKILSVPAVAGLLALLADRKQRFFAFSLLLLIASNVAFLSTFYSPDARYFLFLIPTLLFGIALLLSAVSAVCVQKKMGKVFLGLMGILILIAFGASAVRLKNQISLNLRHAETPWYYISVLELNQAVDDLHLQEKPVVISSLPPFLVDFYSGDRYTLLPLHSQQEFRGEKEAVFGPYEYSDLPALYTRELQSGKKVLVEKYGLGNETMLQNAFADLSKRFELTKIHDGCHDLCTVYELHLKK